jgi:hypothetical protein
MAAWLFYAGLMVVILVPMAFWSLGVSIMFVVAFGTFPLLAWVSTRV